jgi:hypothetical protein
LLEVDLLKQRLKEDPNFELTAKQKNLLEREERYQQHKKEFYTKNP